MHIWTFTTRVTKLIFKKYSTQQEYTSFLSVNGILMKINHMLGQGQVPINSKEFKSCRIYTYAMLMLCHNRILKTNLLKYAMIEVSSR